MLSGVFVSTLACLPNEKVRLRSEGAPSYAENFVSKTRPAFVTVEKNCASPALHAEKRENPLRSPAGPLLQSKRGAYNHL